MKTIDDEESILEKEELELKYDQFIFPDLIKRIKAIFADMLILLICFAIISMVIDSMGDTPSFVKGFISFCMLVLYDPLLTSLTGSTLGHKIMNLKVRKYNDPKKNISIIHAFLRFIAKALLGWISFLTVTGNKRKRAIHDMIGGSVVLNK